MTRGLLVAAVAAILLAPITTLSVLRMSSLLLVTLAAALVVTLLFAILGGLAGDRFHRRIDRFAAREHYEEVA
jgi:hypothetical protein